MKDVEWKAFKIDELFEISATKSGIDKNKLNTKTGNIPYITRTDLNNGINMFVSERQLCGHNIDDGNVITIGLDTQTVFYQERQFYTGQNIQILKNEYLNKNIASFIIPLLKLQLRKFNWGGNGATLGRLRRSNVILPSKNGKPDYEFMQKYVLNNKEKQNQKLIRYYQQKIDNIILEEDISSLENVEWKEFRIGEICDIKSGLRLTKKNQQDGSIPFIGASDSDNGVTGFISNINDSMDKNLLGVNYNGNVVHSFYHPYTCIFSDDVKRLHLKKKNLENKETYLFIKQIILQQQEKYAYGYKFNTSRMKRQIILLPVDDAGSPNWAYMESYIKNIEAKQIRKILRYLTYTYV